MDKNDVRIAAMHALMVPEHEMVDSVARAILAERKRCADAVIHSCMYGHYASEGTCLVALDKIDAVSAQMHKGNVKRFREFMESSPPPTVFRLEAGA